ncbi:charged multivesicular body protein 7 isoform X2 [Ambystoma mexicanum]|uniref:charged multivesicular body protein 7 isoform X2 n=1 Tax=Ambystoma mexicanum TaxID=8296 RepID=UPI0037E94438
MATMGHLPPEWEDDERMAFLFSAFKQSRDVNSTEWDSKIAFWAPLVVNNLRQRGSVSLTLRELNEGFKRKGSAPLGLGTVLEEMIRRGELQRETQFVAGVDSGWISWGVGLLLVKPLKWTLSTVLGGGKVPADEPFVVLELVKEKAAALFQNYKESPMSSHAVSLPELRSLCSDVCKDETVFCLALVQLQKEKKVMVVDKNGEKIVKFARSLKENVSPVSDVDMGIYQLVQSEKMLSLKVDSLSGEAERFREEARCACKSGKKQLALRCLKSNKRIDRRINELHSKLDTVQGILDRIYNSQTDRMVIDAYQAGLGALKLAMKDVTPEKAESLVDQIQEFCDTQDDINQTLSGLTVDSLDMDSEELERELDLLLQDTTTGSLDLPDVPQKPLPPIVRPFPSIAHTEDLESRTKVSLSRPHVLEPAQ